MAKFNITRSESTKLNSVDWDNLGFGVFFSDHMYVSDYDGKSWNNGEIIPYGPMPMEPTLCTLHYGQSVFEGLKAFRDVKGGANLFRPIMNARRMNNSSVRVCIPEFDENKFVDAAVELIKTDKDWIPKQRGHSLYLRPLAYGSSNFLGVHASKTYKMIIMASPVASYYKEGLNPVKILVASEFSRAVRGGLGSAKTAANYAASLYAGNKAQAQGYSQVLWLDAVTRDFVDEVGAMNIFFVLDNEIVTPALDNGTILAGVTRDSVLALTKDWGMKVSERQVSIDEVKTAHANGKLNEVFGTGTAAVISPVGQLTYKGKDMIINDGKIGPISQRLYDTITGIQFGELEDKFKWNVHIDL